MTTPICLIVHVHLPAGASDEVAELTWARCLQPLIGAIHHTPDVRVGLVLGGEQIEDLQQRHPEGLQWVRNLVRREQVELLGTALHDPVLTAIPERDAVGQYVAHARLLVQAFGVRPSGAWLPHGVWDPVVPRILGDAGFKFVVVDDSVTASLVKHEPDATATATGALPATTAGLYYTERDGRRIAVLSADSALHAGVPDQSVKTVLARIARRARGGATGVVVSLDGARFGLRPDGAPDRDRAWFATLLAAIGRGAPAVDTALPHAMVGLLPNNGMVYLPASGAAELPWERTILRRPEAVWLHRRMLRVSRMVERLDRAVHGGSPNDRRPDPSQLEQAHRYLYRAQSAGTYTHGPHAGIYDAHDRARAWRDLIRAERVVLEALRAHQRMIGETTDLDLDGVDEIAMLSPTATAAIDPARGGGVVEWSLLGSARNVFDTITRVPERYHGANGGNDDPTSHEVTARGDERTAATTRSAHAPPDVGDDVRAELQYDPAPRRAFILRVLGAEDDVHALAAGLGHDLAPSLRGPWVVGEIERHGDESVDASLSWEGALTNVPGSPLVRVGRRYRVHRDPRLEARFDVTNRGGAVIRCRVALLVHLGLAAERDARVLLDGQRLPLDRPHDAGPGLLLKAEALDFHLELTMSPRAHVWTWPIRSVHQDRGQTVVGAQGLAVALVWPLEVWDKERARMRVELTAFTP
jgi:alpha-amylase